MRTFEFYLHLASDDVSEGDANRLYECGCDDATSGVSGGKAFVHFAREAEALELAIHSALRDVRKAGFQVVRVEFDEDDLGRLEDAADTHSKTRV